MLSVDLQKCASCVGGEHFFRNNDCDPYVRAWWGQKVKMSIFHMFLQVFLKAQGGDEGSTEELQVFGPDGLLGENALYR